MILYLDTSSLVKLFLEEEHSEFVWEWTREAEIVATSRVAFPEAMSALARRFREGDIDPAGLKQVSEALKAQWHHLAVIDIDELAAGELAVKHCLRGFDAIHLDAAIAVRNTNSRARVTFSSFDIRLNGAAENEGFEVFSRVTSGSGLEI